MLIVKSDERTEAGGLPDEKFMTAMDKFNEELVKTGALLAAEGLHPSSKGARLKLADGERTLSRGPFGEPHKLVAGYWIIEADSKEEAVEWAKRVPFEADEAWFASGGVGQIEIRRVLGPEDFPGDINEAEWREQNGDYRAATESEPAVEVIQQFGDETPLKRFFCVANADADSEAGIPPSPEYFAAMEEFTRKMASSGVLLGGEGLSPSSEGARVTFSGGTRLVTDGPFIETKELIAGFAIIQAKSLDEVIDMSWGFLEVGGNESSRHGACEIRQIFDMSDFPAELVAQQA
jgi:hypothetical protein